MNAEPRPASVPELPARVPGATGSAPWRPSNYAPAQAQSAPKTETPREPERSLFTDIETRRGR